MLAQFWRQLVEPALLLARLRQHLAELDHVGVGEFVQIHPHHRFRDLQDLGEEVPNSNHDVVSDRIGPLGTDVPIDPHPVPRSWLPTDEMLVGTEIAKYALSEGDRGTGEPVVDARNPYGDLCLGYGGDLIRVGVAHVCRHSSLLTCTKLANCFLETTT